MLQPEMESAIHVLIMPALSFVVLARYLSGILLDNS